MSYRLAFPGVLEGAHATIERDEAGVAHLKTDTVLPEFTPVVEAAWRRAGFLISEDAGVPARVGHRGRRC